MKNLWSREISQLGAQFHFRVANMYSCTLICVCMYVCVSYMARICIESTCINRVHMYIYSDTTSSIDFGGWARDSGTARNSPLEGYAVSRVTSLVILVYKNDFHKKQVPSENAYLAIPL